MFKYLKGDKPNHKYLMLWFLVNILISSHKCIAKNSGKVFSNRLSNSRQLLFVLDDFPWLDQEVDMDSYEGGAILSRVHREANSTSDSKSVWGKIEEFYSDKNNMAMFCVLPVMVLVYGGCCAIYCIYKCRQFWRRRKHKRLKEEDCESLTSGRTDLSLGSKDISQISKSWPNPQGDISEKKWSGQSERKPLGKSSPLPWQTPLMTTAGSAHVKETHRITDPKSFEESRAFNNMTDYASNRSSATKATDFSRFSDSRPIEIIPLTADPNLRIWDPLHNRPLGERYYSRDPTNRIKLSDQPGSSGAGPTSVQEMKEEILARYDALSTLQMAKKAAQILSNNAVEINPFERKQNKKKLVFIAE